MAYLNHPALADKLLHLGETSTKQEVFAVWSLILQQHFLAPGMTDYNFIPVIDRHNPAGIFGGAYTHNGKNFFAFNCKHGADFDRPVSWIQAESELRNMLAGVTHADLVPRAYSRTIHAAVAIGRFVQFYKFEGGRLRHWPFSFGRLRVQANATIVEQVLDEIAMHS